MVANTADVVRTGPEAGTFARLADRWIYVFMAALFVATALVGFVPDSARFLAAIEAGQRPPLYPVLHAHAIAMGTWLLLLLTQTTLVATGRTTQHRTLGLVGMVLMPIIVVFMYLVARSAFIGIASLPPGAIPAEQLAVTQGFVSNILLEQLRSIVLFSGFIAWALAVRKRDSETHRRLMILATLIPLPAAINRIAWLPGTMPDSPASIWLYQLLWLVPVLAYDLWRRGAVHRAYVIGMALNVPFIVATHLLWGTEGWREFAPRVMGLPGW